jgi:inositol transport system substrate-binding protein
MEKKYTISILLTKSGDFISKLIYYFTGRGYTHASIGIDDEEDTYYSFNIKGFRKEHPKRHKDTIKDSICYELDVTREEHENMTSLINEFQKERFSWKYDSIGLILTILHIPHKRKKHYICSQFVAELLENAKIMKLSKNPSLYVPNRLGQEVKKLLKLRNVDQNPLNQ